MWFSKAYFIAHFGCTNTVLFDTHPPNHFIYSNYRQYWQNNKPLGNHSSKWFEVIQSAKSLMVPPKCEIIMVPFIFPILDFSLLFLVKLSLFILFRSVLLFLMLFQLSRLQERATTIAIAIVGRTITLERAIKKRSKELIQ